MEENFNRAGGCVKKRQAFQFGLWGSHKAIDPDSRGMR